MNNYFNSIIKILRRSNTKLSKIRVLFSYLNIILRANFYNKLNKKVNKRINSSINIIGFKVYFSEYPLLLNLFEEIFIQEIYAFDTENPTPTIIDCGSNIGMSVLYFKKTYPKALIIGYEPDPKIFGLLKKNIENNSLKNVIVYNAAVGKTNGNRMFYKKENDLSSLNGSLIKTQHHSSSFLVTILKISDSLSGYIDVIKVDVEGSEDEVLEDLIMSNKIKYIKQILVGYHSNCMTSLDEITSILSNNNFQCIHLDPISSDSSEKMLLFKNLTYLASNV